LAAKNLPVLDHPDFPQVFSRAINVSLGTMVDNAFASVHLTRCYWSDEHCDCKAIGTVHHIESGRDFCARHFILIVRGVDRG
jgi:hypothetical protein